MDTSGVQWLPYRQRGIEKKELIDTYPPPFSQHPPCFVVPYGRCVHLVHLLHSPTSAAEANGRTSVHLASICSGY